MFTTRTKNLSEADVYGVRVHMYTGSAYTGPYRYIGAWGRRYGCARAFSQPQGTNHYFIFHFVYFNSRGDANPNDSASKREAVDKEEKTKTAWKKEKERERERSGKERKKGHVEKGVYIGRKKKKMVAGFSKSPCKVHFCRPEFLLTWLSFFVPFFFVFFFVLRFFSLRAAALFCDTSTFRKDSGQGWRVEVNSCDVLVKIQWNLLCRLSLYTWLVRGMKSRFLWESDF